jgi:hypothetical protein
MVLTVLASCGPSKPHLTEGYGASYGGAFATQRVRQGAPAKAALGLDPQEAAITARNYRNSLAPKGGEAREQPMLYVAPSQDRPGPLAPSVPKE